MRGGNRKRAALGLTALAVAGLAVWGVAFAQGPGEPRGFPTGIGSTPLTGDYVPPLVIDDPNVEPAQYTRPVSTTGTARPVADPPSPVVRIQVRVPADSPPDDDIKYVITVQNTSQADAHQVMVRNPLPEGSSPVRAEPRWDDKEFAQNPKQLVWFLGTLKPGQSKNIELVLKPKPGASEVKNLAYVRFEHGEAVTTKINRPTLKVSKTAPKQSIRDEAYTVRVTVENAGKVPAEAVRVVEMVEKSSEVEAMTTGGKRTNPAENQWAWEFAKLMPGERKTIEYRVTPRQAKESLTLTVTEAGKGVLEKAETRTQVLVPGLTVKLAGPTGVVGPGESAKYEITVRNTGTLPSTNVQVVGTLPADCKPTMKTEGGQVYRDQITWAVPRLEPDEARTFRFAIKASTTGRRAVVASAQDARKMRAADELATLFQGTAALVWESKPDPAALAVGRQGTFTVRVKNEGGEAARNVRVEVDVPPEANVVQTTPAVRPTGRVVVFAAESIPAYGEALYTVTFKAEQSGQAWFRIKMTGEPLGDNPMRTEKAVEITGGK